MCGARENVCIRVQDWTHARGAYNCMHETVFPIFLNKVGRFPSSNASFGQHLAARCYAGTRGGVPRLGGPRYRRSHHTAPPRGRACTLTREHHSHRQRATMQEDGSGDDRIALVTIELIIFCNFWVSTARPAGDLASAWHRSLPWPESLAPGCSDVTKFSYISCHWSRCARALP